MQEDDDTEGTPYEESLLLEKKRRRKVTGVCGSEPRLAKTKLHLQAEKVNRGISVAVNLFFFYEC